jgi:anti-repressor protein
MAELIPVVTAEIGGQPITAVDARELHGFLEVGRDFTNWIKDRIEQYGFIEGQDFTVFDSPNSADQSGRGGDRRSKRYAISLDMAKELSMVERNEKGKQARQYFIECERRAKSAPDPMAVLNDPAAMRGLLLTYSEKVLNLESKVAEQAPKVAALDRLSGANGAVCITTAAKDLQVGPQELFRWLQANGWIYRRPGGSGWLAYQTRLQQGVLTHKVTTIERNDGTSKQTEQVLVTPKGLARLAELLSTKAA